MPSVGDEARRGKERKMETWTQRNAAAGTLDVDCALVVAHGRDGESGRVLIVDDDRGAPGLRITAGDRPRSTIQSSRQEVIHETAAAC